MHHLLTSQVSVSFTSSYREARRALSECRASCRDYYRGLDPEDLPDMIKLYGGLEAIDDNTMAMMSCPRQETGSENEFYFL